MKWFVGLGNPGRRYAKTRHNVGFMTVDLLAEQWDMTWRDGKGKALIGEGHVSGQKVALIKPQTYMNLSGEAVKAFMDFYKLDIANMLVIYDDLDTEFGHLRLRYKGGSGGHNGIKSIIQHIGTEQFNRIRLGISQPPAGDDVAVYVLSKFARKEMPTLNDMLIRACEAAEYTLHHPFDKVMARFN